MLYELIGVVRPGRGLAEIKEVARLAGNTILERDGVVRGITDWGTFLLPRPITKLGTKYHQGHHFILRFDSNAPTQNAVKRTLRLDPRIIRFSMVKMGSKLSEISDVEGKADWGSA